MSGTHPFTHVAVGAGGSRRGAVDAGRSQIDIAGGLRGNTAANGRRVGEARLGHVGRRGIGLDSGSLTGAIGRGLGHRGGGGLVAVRSA